MKQAPLGDLGVAKETEHEIVSFSLLSRYKNQPATNRFKTKIK